MGARYKAVYKNGKLLAEYEGGELVYLAAEYAPPKRSENVSAPMIIRDIGEYQSPLDGTMITSRSAHREHVRRHDVVEVGNEKIGSMTPSTVSAPKVDRDLGQAIKRRLDEVKAMPQAQYDEHVTEQRAEHQAIGDLATVTV